MTMKRNQMKKIAQILDDIDSFKKEAFIPNPAINSPDTNPQLGQAMQQLQQVAQGLPPEAQQQLQQQMQQLQQLPADQQLQAIGQLTQQVQQMAQQSGGGQGGQPGQDPNQPQGGQPQPGQDPNQPQQPQGGQPQDPNAQSANSISQLSNQKITLSIADLLNIATKGSHAQTQAKIQGSTRDAQLESQILEMKHQEKIQQFKQKQQQAAAEKQQQEALAQQQQQALGGGGIYGTPMGQPPQPQGQPPRQ